MIRALSTLKRDTDSRFKKRTGLKRKILSIVTNYILEAKDREALELMFTYGQPLEKELIRLITSYVKTYSISGYIVTDICTDVLTLIGGISYMITDGTIYNGAMYYDIKDTHFREEILKNIGEIS